LSDEESLSYQKRALVEKMRKVVTEPELNDDEMLITGELIDVRLWQGAARSAAGRTGVDD
jgi:hypothetical protein